MKFAIFQIINYFYTEDIKLLFLKVIVGITVFRVFYKKEFLFK